MKRQIEQKIDKENTREVNAWIIRIIILLSLMLGSIYLLNGFPTITGNAIISQSDIPQNESRVIGSLFILQGVLVSMIYNRRERRGQAAMEFLLTYGWVILAGLIALGVFIYIVGFSKSAIPSQEFTLDPPWYGNGYRFNIGNIPNTIDLEVKNNGPTRYNIERVNVPGCNVNNNIIPVEAGASKKISFNCNSNIPNNLRSDVKLTYRIPGNTFSQEVVGKLNPPAKHTTQVGASTVTCTVPSSCGQYGMYTYTCTNGNYYSSCVTLNSEYIVTYSPQTQTRTINTQATVVAHVSDLNGLDIPGTILDVFLIGPTNFTQPASVTTDVNGDAVYQFTQSSAGTWRVMFKSRTDGQSLSGQASVNFI